MLMYKNGGVRSLMCEPERARVEPIRNYSSRAIKYTGKFFCSLCLILQDNDQPKLLDLYIIAPSVLSCLPHSLVQSKVQP